MSPKVSVILPIYNAGHYLEQCLDSMVAQTLTDMEIICVNDGSTDGSDEVIRSYCRGDSRFSMIDKPNGGYGQSMNRGLDAAKGEYIGIVEPDDFVDPQMFEKLYEAATCYTPHAQIAKGPYWRVCEADSPDERTFRSCYKGSFKGQRQPFNIFERNDFLYRHPSIWSAIYEKAFLDEHSIRFKEIPGAGWADNPFFIQTLCQAERICYVDEPFYHYREDNISGSSNLKDYNIPFDRWNDMMDFLDEKGIRDRGVLEGSTAARSPTSEGSTGVSIRTIRASSPRRGRCSPAWTRTSSWTVSGYPRISRTSIWPSSTRSVTRAVIPDMRVFSSPSSSVPWRTAVWTPRCTG